MPADGQPHPTNPNLIYDADKKGYVSTSAPAAGGGVDPYTQFHNDYKPLFNQYGIDFFSPIGHNIVKYFLENPFPEETVEGMLWNAAKTFQTGPFAPGVGSNPMPSGSSYSSTQASQAQAEAAAAALAAQQHQYQMQQLQAQQAWQAEQDRLEREQQAALEAQRIEESKRQGTLGTLRDLVTTFAQNQSRARETLFQLGPDAFKFAAGAQGLPLFGKTPQAGFEQALTAFSNTPMPVIDANAPRAALEQQVQQVTPMVGQIPMAPVKWGMADGGFLPFGNPPIRVAVGEEGPEIMEVTPQGVRVIPNDQAFGPKPMLRAAEGIQFDKNTLQTALNPLIQAMGMTVNKIGQGDYGNVFNATNKPAEGSNAFGAMGWRPSFMRDQSTGALWFYDNAMNQYRHIANENMLNGLTGGGWPEKDAVVEIGNVNELPAPVNNADPFDSAGDLLNYQKAQAKGFQSPAFGPTSMPLVEPTTGLALPAPYKVAGALQRLRLTNPGLFEVLLSAYEQADFPRDSVLAQMSTSMVQGIDRHIVGLR